MLSEPQKPHWIAEARPLINTLLKSDKMRPSVSHAKSGLILLACCCLFILTQASVVLAGDIRLPRSYRMMPYAQSVGTISDSVPGSNTIVDFIVDGDNVWAATGNGVSRYSRTTGEWTTARSEDGLGANEIPAILVIGSDVWAATSHTGVVERQNVQFGDGLFLSMDGGSNWMKATPDNNQAAGPFQLCFDFATIRGNVYAACFAGGLVVSGDMGSTWENIFASSNDRTDFESRSFLRLTNRYFATAVDTAVAESLAIYTGTAGGIHKYIYLDSTLKLTGDYHNWLTVDGDHLYLGTEHGLSRSTSRGSTWLTAYTDAGLPGNDAGFIYADGDTILAGINGSGADEGAGLALSVDGGATWTGLQPTQAIGAGRRVRSIIPAAGAWWAACGSGGLIRSVDQGQTWENVFPDSGLAQDFRTHNPPQSHVNTVNTLIAFAQMDTTFMFVGTDSGFVGYLIPHDSLPTSHTTIRVVAPESGFIGRRVLRLKAQQSPTAGLVIWSINDTIPGSTRRPGYAVSIDSTANWLVGNDNRLIDDIAFSGDSAWIASQSSVFLSIYPDFDNLISLPGFQTLRTANAVGTQLHSIAVEYDLPATTGTPAAVWVTTDSGTAAYFPSSNIWSALHPNLNPLRPDVVINSVYTAPDSTTVGDFVALSGNFVTAVAVQRIGNGRIVWAATQTTGTGQKNGISKSSDGGKTWSVPITGHRVWNFAFDGGDVWAATSEGLLRTRDGGVTWDTLRNFVDPSSGARVDSLSEIFAVAVVGDEIWAGSENGLAILDRNDPTTVIKVRRTFQPVTADQGSGEGGCYATPVPFSPNYYPNGIHFHYTPPVDGPVTITVYDFANREVRIVTNGEERKAGVTYDEADVWDGRNGKGDMVATGTYFFVIEYANGDVHWGKTVVLP